MKFKSVFLLNYLYSFNYQVFLFNCMYMCLIPYDNEFYVLHSEKISSEIRKKKTDLILLISASRIKDHLEYINFNSFSEKSDFLYQKHHPRGSNYD